MGKLNNKCPYDLCDICRKSLPPCYTRRRQQILASNGIALINSLDKELRDVVNELSIVSAGGALTHGKKENLLSDIKEAIRVLLDVKGIVFDLKGGAK